MITAAARILPLLLLLTLGFTFAQGESESVTALAKCGTLETHDSVPHTAEWICAVARIANQLGLFKWIDGIAWAVLLVFFVARTLSISLDPNPGPKLRVFLTAAAFAFGLMLSLTPIRSAMFDMWRFSYSFSQTRGADAAWEALADIANQINPEEAATAMAAREIAANAGKNMAGAAGVLAVDDASKGAVQLRRGLSAIKGAGAGLKGAMRAVPVFRIIDAVLLPIISLYSMIIFGSALAIILGAFVLPIGAVMIVTGNGAGFLSNWSKVMLGAVLTMVVFPIMWGITVQLAIATPLTTFLHDVNQVVDNYKDLVAQLEGQSSTGLWDQIVNIFGGFVEKTVEAVKGGFAILGSAVAMIFNFVIGIITAFGMIFLLQTLIQKFIGGISAQATSMTFGKLGIPGKGKGKDTADDSGTSQTKTTAGGGGGGGNAQPPAGQLGGGGHPTLSPTGGRPSAGPARQLDMPHVEPPAPLPVSHRLSAPEPIPAKAKS